MANLVNRAQYVSEDFSTYRAEADEFFRSNYPEAYNNLIATDIGNALMDQLAYAMQSLAFMVNRKASELYLDTARLNSSITKIAKMLGYQISTAHPSSCDATITLSQSWPFEIQIPIGFQFKATGDIVYEYRGDNPFIIPSGTTTFTIPLKEGKTKRLVFTSDGTENQQFSIYGIPSGEYMYSDDLVMTVNGTEWTEVSPIRFENEDYFEVLYTDNPPKLRFGDGIAGNIPKATSQIVLKFVYGKGLKGAIGSNQISGPASPLVVNGETVVMSITNTVANTGRDPEDIRSVRSLASTFFRSQAAAVIKADYDDISKKVSGVVLADAQTIRGVDADLTLTGHFSSLGSISAAIPVALASKEASLSAAIDLAITSATQKVTTDAQTQQITDSVTSLSTAVSSITTNVDSLTAIIQAMSASTEKTNALALLNTISDQQDSLSAAISTLSTNLPTLITNEIDKTDLLTKLNTAKTQSLTVSEAVDSQIASLNTTRSGMSDYLSYILSDTSKSNHVQVIILSVNNNNRYIAPSSATISDVEAKLKAIADAAVTITVVDGSGRIVPVDLTVNIGISQSAIKEDVESLSTQALLSTSIPYGLLIRRDPGKALYKSEIQEAILAANNEGDIAFLNISITSPSNQLDSAGNLIIEPQQVIQDGTVTVRATKRVVANEEKPI